MRKKRLGNKEKTDNDTNTKLEKLVNEVIVRRRNEKRGGEKHLFTTLGVPQTTLYRHSYQVMFEMRPKLFGRIISSTWFRFSKNL